MKEISLENLSANNYSFLAKKRNMLPLLQNVQRKINNKNNKIIKPSNKKSPSFPQLYKHLSGLTKYLVSKILSYLNVDQVLEIGSKKDLKALGEGSKVLIDENIYKGEEFLYCGDKGELNDIGKLVGYYGIFSERLSHILSYIPTGEKIYKYIEKINAKYMLFDQEKNILYVLKRKDCSDYMHIIDFNNNKDIVFQTIKKRRKRSDLNMYMSFQLVKIKNEELLVFFSLYDILIYDTKGQKKMEKDFMKEEDEPLDYIYSSLYSSFLVLPTSKGNIYFFENFKEIAKYSFFTEEPKVYINNNVNNSYAFLYSIYDHDNKNISVMEMIHGISGAKGCVEFIGDLKMEENAENIWVEKDDKIGASTKNQIIYFCLGSMQMIMKFSLNILNFKRVLHINPIINDNIKYTFVIFAGNDVIRPYFIKIVNETEYNMLPVRNYQDIKGNDNEIIIVKESKESIKNKNSIDLLIYRVEYGKNVHSKKDMKIYVSGLKIPLKIKDSFR